MIYSKIVKKISSNLFDFGHKLFLLGIFFLVSAPFLSLLAFIPSLIIGTKLNKENVLKDTWNIPFFLASILMILSCFVHSQKSHYLGYDYDFKLSIIGLFNWLPLFWIYWGFQPYLNSKKLRKKCLFFLICSSVPFILSGLGQYFLGWYGPYSFLDGFIIWYQRPIDTEVQGLTSFFNNQNYAGSWLSIIFYISLAFAMKNEQIKLKKLISILISFSVGFSVLLTYSRNAILSIIFFFLFFIKSKTYLKILFIFLCIIIFLLIYSGSPNYINNIIPLGFYYKLNDLSLQNILSTPRVTIWSAVINMISEKPLFGWGAGSFHTLFKSFDLTNINAQHSHNLFLDISFSYGLPSAILISINLIYLTLKNLIREFNSATNSNLYNKNIFDIAWKTSTGIFLFSHLFDITYFDARISIFAWILFSGMRNILKENSMAKAIH